MDINLLLKKTIERNASDLHLKVGNLPILRVDGRLVPLEDEQKITQEDAIATAFAIMNNSNKQRFKEKSEADFAYSASGLGRFRVNVFQQRGTIGIVMRAVPTKILSIDDLNLPKVLEKLSMEQRGLILVTGTTGCGKTTTLASMIDFMNRNRSDNIITIEDPIEYLHRDKKSIISQREIGNDTESFGVALRSALRQDPDIILVGEMRDFETISTALVAAETGHLVLSTLHTIDSAETINRIISVFPPYQQKQVRLQLASIIKGIISMRLVPRADGKGRVPAVEVMVATQTIRECIIDPDKSRKIPDIIAAGLSQYGMQTFDQSLYDLYKKGLVTLEEALRWCSNPDDFTLKVKGIQSTSDLTWEATGKEGQEKGQEKIKVDRFGK
ncbi:MAG: type IV pilus twitching motility protein PilT [Nitrospirota bacterium]